MVNPDMVDKKKTEITGKTL